ncbi:MAG TPA: DUF1015 domain-containing protein [Ilumatobacter sp.]|nr:DUF1015 domain-containing protein [Ilumatobacter sp.]
MPRFDPFPALRYAAADLGPLVAPPYDVLSERDVDELEARHPHNIVHVDVPRERDGAERYEAAAARLRSWIAEGVMVRDHEPSFTLYRMSFTDEAGRARRIVGVVGALEVVDEGAGGVLPHERTTPKASTDRLDLTRATAANLSPVWGLSLADGLTTTLAAPAEPVGSVTVDGVAHSVERVTDRGRIAEIAARVGGDDVLIADGHHRYSVSRTYRDEVRARTGTSHSAAELTLAFVSELVEDQLSVAAIHRVYRSIDRSELLGALEAGFTTSPAGPVDSGTLAAMRSRGSLCLLDRDGNGTWLDARPGAFDSVRPIDGAWLEHLLATSGADVDYQHGVDEVRALMRDDPSVVAAVLIRPVSVSEIERTAREGLLMPPKSTFFTPKLRTGFVVRELA